jgi:hypothetical protein
MQENQNEKWGFHILTYVFKLIRTLFNNAD